MHWVLIGSSISWSGVRGREGAGWVFFRPVAVCSFNGVGQDCGCSRKAVSQSSSAHYCVECQAYWRVLFLFHFIYFFLHLSRTLWMVKALQRGSKCENKRKTHPIIASGEGKKKENKRKTVSWIQVGLCLQVAAEGRAPSITPTPSRTPATLSVISCCHGDRGDPLMMPGSF